MLFKLLKYDFRSMWKQFSIIWPAALIIGLINRFTLPFSSDSGANWVVSQEWMSIISITLFFGVMFSMFVASVVFVLTRFYRGLLGDEGYLMHTLPVHPWQLVLSKLLCALVVTVVNTVVAVLALFLMMPLKWSDLFDVDFWKMIVQGLMEQPDSILYLVEFLVMILVFFAMVFTSVYLSMAIGHLFHRHRVLMSVVAYMGLDIVGSLILNVLDRLSLYPMNWALNLDGHLSLWAGIALLLIPTVLMFLGTSYILKNKLNLE